jgi:superkiller protein 8
VLGGGLTKPIRTLAFSPATTLLAAGGDARLIALYEVSSGEAVATLSGHSAWILSLDFSATGEWLLSTAFDGKAKVWGMEQRNCVATHGEGSGGTNGGDEAQGKALWCGRWLPKQRGAVGNVRAEMFAVAGAGRGVSFYREASGG